MPIYRYVEITAYALLSFLPYLVLAYYPFRGELRFSRWVPAAFLPILVALQSASYIYAAEHRELWFVALGQTFLLALLFCLSLRAHWGKALFTLLMLSNISNFVLCAAKCLEGLLFPKLALEQYRWSNVLTLFLAAGVILIPIFFFFKRVYVNALKEERASVVWRYIWVVPLTFYSVWFRNFYFSAEGAEELALRPRHLLYTLVINSGALLIYAVVMRLIREQAVNDMYREKEVQLLIKQKQFETLQERIEEARTAKHDMRQHLHMLSALLADKKYAELEAYINGMRRSVTENSTITYCDNYAVNALLQYFSGVAAAHGVAFSVSLSLPGALGIPDDVIAVLLGNLLENATEACMAEREPIITVRGILEDNNLFFKIANTFTGKTRRAPNGLFLSTKHEGRGIGLRSVRGIVGDYGGMLKIDQTDGMFTVSAMLTLPEEN